MADNVNITPGTGVVVSSEEVTTLNGATVPAQQVQRIANAIRTADGVALDLASGAGAVNTATPRTTLASDDPAVAALQSMQAATNPVLAPSAAVPISGAVTTAMTGTTSTSLLPAPGGSLYNYITTIIVSNSHASVGTDVVIQDGNGGPTLLTIPAAAAYNGIAVTLPIPLKQPTTNTALFCANVTTGASTKVSVVGYKGA